MAFIALRMKGFSKQFFGIRFGVLALLSEISYRLSAISYQL